MFVDVPPPPSPEAKELGAKIAELIRILRAENPSIGRQDIQQGLALARAELRPELGGRNPQMILALVLGLTAMMGLVVYFAVQRGGAHTMIWVVAGMVVLLAVVALAVKR